MSRSEYTANINKFSLANTSIKQRVERFKPVSIKSKITYLGVIKTVVSVVLGSVILAELASLNIVLF